MKRGGENHIFVIFTKSQVRFKRFLRARISTNGARSILQDPPSDTTSLHYNLAEFQIFCSRHLRDGLIGSWPQPASPQDLGDISTILIISEAHKRLQLLAFDSISTTHPCSILVAHLRAVCRPFGACRSKFSRFSCF